MQIDTTELNSTIAERRKKRERNELGSKFHQYMAAEEANRQKKIQQKSQERGWYAVEGIIGHRVVKYKKRDVIELQIKWEGYDEPTWESFTHFVKETTPMVERYLTQKSLMKPLQLQAELDKRKK